MNPVRRGQSGRRGRPWQGLVRRVEQAPWIPNEDDWRKILQAAQAEPLRNRLMVALAYDGALRREELVQLEPGDFEPAWFLIHLRAETTKSQRAREVSFGEATARLFAAYLSERRQIAGRSGGRLLLSVSRRNYGAPLGASSWSKIVTRIAGRAGVPRLSPHTFRHLRLTDLARAEWTIDLIAQYAGHRDLSTDAAVHPPERAGTGRETPQGQPLDPGRPGTASRLSRRGTVNRRWAAIWPWPRLCRTMNSPMRSEQRCSASPRSGIPPSHQLRVSCLTG